jgi:hypothetical protein
MFKTGTIMVFLFYAVIVIFYLYFKNQAEKGIIPNIRPIAAIEAIEEQVGRCVEMGRPVHFTTGQRAEATHPRFSNVLSGLKILGYVAETCVEKGATLIVSVAAQTVFPMVQGIVRSAYVAGGVGDQFTEETVQFLGGNYRARMIGNMERYNIGTHFYIGDIGGSCWIIVEAAARIGATIVAGTPNDSNMVVLSITADYTLLGDEQFAAGAILSKNPPDVASVWALDYMKLACIGLIALGVIFGLFGTNWLGGILSL